MDYPYAILIKGKNSKLEPQNPVFQIVDNKTYGFMLSVIKITFSRLTVVAQGGKSTYLSPENSP